MRIIINKSYGSFGVCADALLELVKINSHQIQTYDSKEYFNDLDGTFSKESQKLHDKYISESEEIDGYLVNRKEYIVIKDDKIYCLKWDEDIDRTDPFLISLIEKYGDKINKKYCKLVVVDIPDDVKWHISSSDHGGEWIEEDHRVWGRNSYEEN